MIASLLFVAAAIAAQDNPPIVVEGDKPVEEKVCRTVRETGSRRVKKVCRTASEQRQDDLDAKNKLGLGNRSTRPPDAFTAPTGQ